MNPPDQNRPTVQQILDELLSVEDIANGSKIVEAETKQWGTLHLRMQFPDEYQRQQVFKIYAVTLDGHEFLKPFLDEEYRSDSFLDQLTPTGEQWLINVAVAICVGRDRLAQQIQEDRAKS